MHQKFQLIQALRSIMYTVVLQVIIDANYERQYVNRKST